MVKLGCVVFGLLVLLIGGPEAKAADCFHLSTGEPRALTGRLDYIMFAGPPNFEDVQKGDTPEPSYVLRLPSPICIAGDEFADPTKRFTSVQLIAAEGTSPRLHDNLNKSVTVTIKERMAANTGHHHEPLVAWVTAVALDVAQPMDFTDEYGTAATTIRAFYSALSDGQGDVAAATILPEKRATPAFLPQALSGFYGHLREPIQLIDITQGDGSHFVVHYRYATATRVCDGKAAITTAVRSGRNFIASIRALAGC